ncbi:MAG: DNA/RNA nuclease SfsA [Pseudomonadota bacterium]
MRLPELQPAALIKRYKRFLADVRLADGRVLTVHCPNTGAMTGCSQPDSRVWLSRSDNPKRKYAYTLELVETAAGVVSVNTGRANTLVHEALQSGVLTLVETGDVSIRPEAAIPEGDGRLDFLLSAEDERVWIEVKSTTLHLGDGAGAFPDAVSTRAAKHVAALQRRVAAGERGVLVFCAQHCGIERVGLSHDIDPDYSARVADAIESGVEVIALGCSTDLFDMRANRRLPFSATDLT